MRIEKPDWAELRLPSINPNGHTLSMAQSQWLDEWFNSCVEPINKLLSEGVEVMGHQDDDKPRWYMFENPCKTGMKSHTHKALLINITPIKKETAEDVLRDILASGSLSIIQSDLVHRAKAVLK